MSFDFKNFEQNIREYKSKYDVLYQDLHKKTENLSILKFSIPPVLEIRSAFSSDGSYATYWKSPLEKFYIGGIRIAFIEERFEENCYKDNCGASNDFIFMDFEKCNHDDKKKINPKSVLGYLMSLGERKKLIEYAHSTTNKLIITDGSIVKNTSHRTVKDDEPREEYRNIVGNETFNKFHEHSSISELIEECKKNNHILIGVSKDSKELKIDGKLRYEIVLENAIKYKQLDKNQLYYHILPINEEHGDDFTIVFAKLHKKAFKWHRIDILNNISNLEQEILPLISMYSQFNQYLGTPRPPQECDKIASEINTRKMNTLKTVREIMLSMGFSFDELYYGTTDQDGESINTRTAHDVYDLANRENCGHSGGFE